MSRTPDTQKRPINVAIIGAGISGLAVANGLLKDTVGRYNVQIYERDTVAYDLERGGYQLRIGVPALQAMKSVLDDEATQMLRSIWEQNAPQAPAMIDPKSFRVCADLASLKLYPQSTPVLRPALRQVLLQRPLAEQRVHFGHQFERYDVADAPDGGVTVHFKDQAPVHVDVLIAADGSGSKINQQTGLNNKVKLNRWTLIQARGVISSEARDALPSTLREHRSVIILGGHRLSGYASVCRQDAALEGAPESARKGRGEEGDLYSLFWSVLVPADKGQAIIGKGDGDAESTRDLLVDHVRRDLGMGEALPTIYNAVHSNLRTGLLTSSFKPRGDWRGGQAALARIILLGDAVHPMTPGRGMGANQALLDARRLVDALRRTTFGGDTPTDEELAALVRPFDAEMYARAFAMVQASEQMTDLDLTGRWGRAQTAVVVAVLTVAGWIVSAAEAVGWRRAESAGWD